MTDKIEHHLIFQENLDYDSASRLRDAILEVSERSDCLRITVLISSEGGSVSNAFRLYCTIRNLDTPVHMHAIGRVGSAAVPLFMAGHRRTAAPHADFLFHGFTYQISDDPSPAEIDEAKRQLERDIERAQRIFAEHSRVGEDVTAALYGGRGDIILSSSEALQQGIIQEVSNLSHEGANGVAIRVGEAQ